MLDTIKDYVNKLGTDFSAFLTDTMTFKELLEAQTAFFVILAILIFYPFISMSLFRQKTFGKRIAEGRLKEGEYKPTMRKNL